MPNANWKWVSSGLSNGLSGGQEGGRGLPTPGGHGKATSTEVQRQIRLESRKYYVERFVVCWEQAHDLANGTTKWNSHWKAKVYKKCAY